MPEPGDVVAQRYRLDSTLSSGGMGSVYIATHTQTGRRFALKVMLADLTGDDEAEHRFLREAKLAGSINHPGVIRVYDVGYHDQHPYMVMELLEGESLGQRLKRAKVEPREAAAIMQRVIDGVAAAHRVGIVHRDLKPDNIYLCRSPDGKTAEPKVLDFGISKSLAANGTQNLTKTGIALGTPLYMSPEQIHGQRDVDQRADVYSLGVILYEMLIGEVPFLGRSYADLALKIITGEHKKVRAIDASIPATLEGIVERAMAADRAQRYETVEAFAQDLRAFTQGSLLPTAPRITKPSQEQLPKSLTPFATEALPAPGSEPRRSVAPTRNGTLFAGAVAAGCALATGAFWLQRSGHEHAAGAPVIASPSATRAAAAAPPSAASAPVPAAAMAPAPALAPPSEAALPMGRSTPVGEDPRAVAPSIAPTVARSAPSQLVPKDKAVAATIKKPVRHAEKSAGETMAPAETYEVREEKLIDPFER